MENYQPSWRGKNIGQRKDSFGKYIKMMGPDALLYIPINANKNSKYKISIEAAKNGGNGIVYCNIYGNKNYDFPQTNFTCNSLNWSQYEVFVTTKNFPKSISMIFRIWRSSKGTGSILIRKISVELIDGEENIPTNILNNIPDINNLNSTKQVTNRSRKPKQRDLINKKRRRKKLTTKRHNRITSDPIKVEELSPGKDNIKNSVIISLKDRADFLNRTLYSYAKQTMSKKDFEIVIVDDNSKEDILEVCKKHSLINKLQFQYIKVDTSKGAYTQKGFTPALTNNIGFKNARGSVLIITGPETLQGENNLELTWDICKAPKCVYGVVYRSNSQFVDKLKENKKWVNYNNFKEILSINGAIAGQPDLTGFWWYYAAARKEYILNINGIDERYMLGISGEDDDFAERMSLSGIKLLHDRRITGIHQDHTREDRLHPDHKFRFNKREWDNLRNLNCALLEKCMNGDEFIVNKNIEWGTEKAIIYKEVF